MTHTDYQRCGTMHAMSPSLVPILHAAVIILIVFGFVGFIVALVPSTAARLPRLFPAAITVLVIGLAFGVVLFVLESAY